MLKANCPTREEVSNIENAFRGCFPDFAARAAQDYSPAWRETFGALLPQLRRIPLEALESLQAAFPASAGGTMKEFFSWAATQGIFTDSSPQERVLLLMRVLNANCPTRQEVLNFKEQVARYFPVQSATPGKAFAPGAVVEPKALAGSPTVPFREDLVSRYQPLLTEAASNAITGAQAVPEEEHRALFILPDGSFSKEEPSVGPAERWKDTTFSVGRVNKGGSPIGSAFYIADNRVMTAAHVANKMFNLDTKAFLPGLSPSVCTLDFGALVEGPKAKFVSVLASGTASTDLQVSSTDVAVLQIEWELNAKSGNVRPIKFSSVPSPTLGSEVAVVGFPVAPEMRLAAQTQAALNVFNGISGIKRLQPGKVALFEDSFIWHNCSTLGGNSGSVLVTVNNPGEAVGIHVGFKVRNGQLYNLAVTAQTATQIIAQART